MAPHRGKYLRGAEILTPTRHLVTLQVTIDLSTHAEQATDACDEQKQQGALTIASTALANVQQTFERDRHRPCPDLPRRLSIATFRIREIVTN